MASLRGVKLVVWDLDDTFWTGTLSEGGIQPRREMQELLIKLARMGIVSSICSNNDLEPAREALQTLGVWDYFVFPAVSWSSKPSMMAALIESMQLRPQNVLFVDDKPRVRELVQAALPDLLPPCDDAALLAAFRGELAFASDTDPALERLEQYKLLERRAAARTAAATASVNDTESFLASCQIRCHVIADLGGLEGRLADLVSRANQLNFTRRRRTTEELATLLADERHRCRAIRVVDRFGDYGICGFFAQRRDDGSLTDFLFSCRVLEMGVEDAIYAWLGSPPVIGDGSAESDAARQRLAARSRPAFWVQILECDRDIPDSGADRAPASDRFQVLVAGGCELLPIHAYLEARPPVPLELTTQFTFTNSDGVRTTSFAAASLLRLASRADLVTDHSEVLARLPWFDRSAFSSPLFTRHFDAYVGSAARDYFLANYRYRDGSFAVPFEYFRAGLTDFTLPENAERLREASKRNAPAVSDQFLQWFAGEFSFEGPLSPEAYIDHLTWLCTEVCSGSIVVMLNCTEREIDWVSVPRDWRSRDDMIRHREHNRTMNRALWRAADSLPNLRVVDVNRYIEGPDDAPDPLHFSRRVLFRITMEVSRILVEYAAAAGR